MKRNKYLEEFKIDVKQYLQGRKMNMIVKNMELKKNEALKATIRICRKKIRRSKF